MAVLPGVPGTEVRILVNCLPTEEWPFEGNMTREASEEDIKTDEHKAGPPDRKMLAFLPETAISCLSRAADSGCPSP